MAFCNALTLTLAQVLVGTVPRCPAAYTLTIKNNGRQALLAGARLRLESDDPIVTALRTCTFSSDSANVSDVLVSNGVLTFTLDVGIEACASVELEFGVETVNVSARASRNVVLRAFLDTYAFVDTAARRCNAPVPDPYHAKPVIVSNALCALVNVTDDCAPPQPNIIYVKPVAAGAADGTGFGCSWETALIGPTGLLTVTTNAKPGDQIWVAVGTYPLRNTLKLTEGVSLYGGFAGTESLLCERCIGRATEGETSDTVFTFAGTAVELANNATVDGITIIVPGNSAIFINGTEANVVHVSAKTEVMQSGNGVIFSNNNLSATLCDVYVFNFFSGIAVEATNRVIVDGARLENNTIGADVRGSACLYDCLIFGGNTGINASTTTSNVKLFNCTVASNSVTGVSLAEQGSKCCAFNSIINNNNEDANVSFGSLAIVSTWITVINPNLTNVTVIDRKTSPPSVGFVDALNGDFQLTATSPALDCGNNAYVKTLTDVAGLPRIVGTKVDLGAYERQTPLGCE